MKRWLSGLAMTIALVCCLMAIWGDGHRGQFIVTAAIFFLVGVGFMGAIEEDRNGREQ